jgi:vitamin B12 transporter
MNVSLNTASSRARRVAPWLLCLLWGGLVAQEQAALPDFEVRSTRVANQISAGTIDMPVSALRYEPRVDVQARNFAEAQADIAIRGGIFESTGFQLGALTLGDPQTGHYAAEIPVPPAMLTPPTVLTGVRNAFSSANAIAGTVSYGWQPIRDTGRLDLAMGTHGYNRQSLYQAASRTIGEGVRLGADLELARSESDGAVPFGDHDFRRAAARLQLRTQDAQTDLFAGYQTKFFGWPNLYTPFGFNETEDLETLLVVLHHRWRSLEGDEFAAGAFYRRHRDDYEFNRAVPGASNPFEHTTWLRGAGATGRLALPALALNLRGQVTQDEIRSTALTFGRYQRRTMAKFGATLETTREIDSGQIHLEGGLVQDASNRHGEAWSPLAMVAWRSRDGLELYAEYSAATQLPTYTALNSSASAGLFRGNPALGRATARNLELGFRGNVAGWSVEAALFRRAEEELVDWTFRRGVIARTANSVDLETLGCELLATRRLARVELVFGYSWLQKQSDYGNASVDASFYALNFPRHRLTAAATLRLAEGWELRLDNEYRVQERNFLRTVGGRHALLSSAGLYYRPSWAAKWELSLLVDNLWASDFQEVPAVPAAGRQLAFGLVRQW